MTEQEMREALDAKNAELAAAQAENEKLKGNESNQNSYITKLEGEVKKMEATLSEVKKVADSPQLDPTLVNYFKKAMKEDVKQKAFSTIINKVGEETFNKLVDELDEFLAATMKESNTTEEYVIDAFNLVYGRALTSGKLATTNEPAVAEPVATEVPSGAELLKELRDNPPVMTNSDNSASSDMPGSHPRAGQPIRNTEEAMKAFKAKFSNLNSDKFI